jgi:hypothetical protein
VEEVSRFKVGDIVIGNEDNHYGITNRENICKVVGFISENEYPPINTQGTVEVGDDMYVEVIESKDFEYDVGKIFPVDSSRFKHCRVVNTRLAKKLYPKANESEDGKWLYV